VLLSTELEVDHINGDKLDNRRANLRVATKTQQRQNQRVTRRNTSGFKGVSRISSTGRWRARIKVSGRQMPCGVYATAESAALAYDAAAREYFGEFARLNFPNPEERGAR
jgi:hypothetical protein